MPVFWDLWVLQWKSHQESHTWCVGTQNRVSVEDTWSSWMWIPDRICCWGEKNMVLCLFFLAQGNKTKIPNTLSQAGFVFFKLWVNHHHTQRMHPELCVSWMMSCKFSIWRISWFIKTTISFYLISYMNRPEIMWQCLVILPRSWDGDLGKQG